MLRRTFLVAIPVAAYGYTFFSADEVRLLEAVCEQLMPGSPEAGVVNYIDRQLSGKGPLARFAPMYREGLAGLHAAGFLAMDFAKRTRFLEDAEAGRVPNVPAATVRMLVDHTMQGFFADPKHGGNKDRVGWKLLGYDAGGHAH